MQQKPKKTGRLARRLAGLLLTAALLVSTLSMAAWAADSYTSVAKGTVSWQMIYQNAGTYFWKDKSGAYCALTAAKSGSSYCVTLTTSSKVCYLRQNKSSTAAKIQKWSGASGVYTGGVLYKKTSTGTGAGDSGSSSGSGSSSEGGYTPVTESEIGKGVGEKTGTKYTGKGTIADEYITLDVYISGGKITGLFIADEVGDWLSLLTQESANYIGKSAALADVSAVSSATTLGFRNTIRDAVANAVAKADTGSGSSSGTASTSYKVDGYDKKYSYSALNSGSYYYLYKGTYYQVKGLKYYSRDKGKYYYCGYFTMNGVRYYLDDTPQAYSSSELSDEHPGDDSSSKAYESCEKSKVSKGKELPLYVAVK